MPKVYRASHIDMLYECYINKVLRSTLKKGYGDGKSILVEPEFVLGDGRTALTSWR